MAGIFRGAPSKVHSFLPGTLFGLARSDALASHARPANAEQDRGHFLNACPTLLHPDPGLPVPSLACHPMQCRRGEQREYGKDWRALTCPLFFIPSFWCCEAFGTGPSVIMQPLVYRKPCLVTVEICAAPSSGPDPIRAGGEIMYCCAEGTLSQNRPRGERILTEGPVSAQV